MGYEDLFQKYPDSKTFPHELKVLKNFRRAGLKRRWGQLLRQRTRF